MNHGGIDKGLADAGQDLVILAQPPIPPEPAKRPFHTPAQRQHLEPLRVGRAADDLQVPAEGFLRPFRQFPAVMLIPPELLQPRGRRVD